MTVCAVNPGEFCKRLGDDSLRELEARRDELNDRLSAMPADLPNIRPNMADTHRARWRSLPSR